MVTPLHKVINGSGSSIVAVLPAIYTLAGSDTMRKVGTKPTVFQEGVKCGYDFLYLF